MVEIFQSIVKPIWEILGQCPMPWRIALEIIPLLAILPRLLFRIIPQFFYGALILILYLSESFVKILVLPEALLAQKFRKRGNDVPKLVYLAGDIVRPVVGFIFGLTEKSKVWKQDLFKKPCSWNFKWIIMVCIILPAIWYSRPILGDTKVGAIIDSGFSWWTSLEGWIVSGNWKSVNSMMISPEEFIRGYFSDINSHNVSKAWNKLSPKFQNNKRLMPNGYASYKEWWDDTVQQVKVTNVTIQERSFNTATVKVNWMYQLAGESNFSEQTFILDLTLDTRSGRWLIDESHSPK
jgi:hypothetical protein